jgi:hypothetical protein
MENIDEKLKTVTRIEVIDEHGRSYVNWNANNKVQLSFQDNDRTLKVFIQKDISSVIHDRDYSPDMFKK